jgi:2'-5' RNA ligase
MADLETMRTFIAVPLTDDLTKDLGTVQGQLRRDVPERAVRWVKPSSIHLTLFFLGDILLDRADPVKEALSVIARHMPPFEFQAGGVGVFPNLRRPRVIWVGVKDPMSGLALLHDTINEAMENLGFKPDTRRFSPHLTLGRVRRRAGRRDVQAVGDAVGHTEVGHLATVPVKEVIFFKSVLKPTGAEYSRLATLKLRGG